MLKAYVLNGMTTKEISEKLDRTTHSIHCRKHSVGMHDVRIQVPVGISRTRKAKPAPVAEKPMVTPKVVKPAAKVNVAKVAKQAVTTKKVDIVSQIAETVSRLTKEHGIKATLIIFEN